MRRVINLRGTVLPIMDLSSRLDLDAEIDSDRNVIIVVADGERTVGLMVDAVSDILAVPEDDLQPPPDLKANNERSFISALMIVDNRMIRSSTSMRCCPPNEDAA
ncbi:MAG: chemotaxis protein CheW [Paracoccaceae bacterium]